MLTKKDYAQIVGYQSNTLWVIIWVANATEKQICGIVYSLLCSSVC